MTADELKHAQQQLGMTNRQLADAMGVSLSTVVKWRGEQHQIPKIAALAVRYLLGQSPRRSSRAAGAGC